MATASKVPTDNLVFRLSRALGLFPFNSFPQLETDRSFLVYSIAFTGGVTTVGAMSMLEDFPSAAVGSYNRVLITAYIGAHMLIFPCSLFQAFLRRRILQEAVQGIVEVHSRMLAIGLRPMNARARLVPLLDVSFLIMTRFLLAYVTVKHQRSLVLFTFETVIHLGMLSICGQYSYLVDTVGGVFQAAVDFLNGLQLSVALPLHGRRLGEVVNVMNRLATASEAINGTYSLQVLLLMSLSFCGLSINLYHISSCVRSPVELSYPILASLVYNVLFYFYVVWRVSRSSAETTEKWKEINGILYKLMIGDRTKEILRDDNLCLHIAMKRELVFTACGFFSLDDTLVHSMLASATAYLVILIQFGQPAAFPETPSSVTSLTTTKSSMTPP